MLRMRRDRSFRYAGVVYTIPDTAEVVHVSPSRIVPMDARVEQPLGRLAPGLHRPAGLVVARHHLGQTLFAEQRQLFLGRAPGPVRQYRPATLARVLSR